MVFTGGVLTPDVIKLTNEVNMIHKKVQGIIVFTSDEHRHLSQNYPMEYEGLVLGVATEFKELTQMFNIQIFLIEQEKSQSILRHAAEMK